MDGERRQLAFGMTVYTEDGTKIGPIRDVDENGLYVTLRDGIEGLSDEHVVVAQRSR